MSGKVTDDLAWSCIELKVGAGETIGDGGRSLSSVKGYEWIGNDCCQLLHYT